MTWSNQTPYPKIEICSPQAMYITIDGYTFYIDNSTNEQIMEVWKEDCPDKVRKFLLRGKKVAQ